MLSIRGGRKKIDSPMHRDSLFNDSEYFRIDSELVFFFPAYGTCAR